MHSHRFRNLTGIWRRSRSQEAPVSAKGFMLCPPALLPAQPASLCAWQGVYQLAFEQAQAVVRPSLLERDLLAHWN
jgi:hypothetical protein